MVLPVPGGPRKSRLWLPAAAISTRLASPVFLLKVLQTLPHRGYKEITQKSVTYAYFICTDLRFYGESLPKPKDLNDPTSEKTIEYHTLYGSHNPVRLLYVGNPYSNFPYQNFFEARRL